MHCCTVVRTTDSYSTEDTCENTDEDWKTMSAAMMSGRDLTDSEAKMEKVCAGVEPKGNFYEEICRNIFQERQLWDRGLATTADEMHG